MRLERSTLGKKNKFARNCSRKTCKKEPHGKAELRSECSKVDVKIIVLIVYVFWRRKWVSVIVNIDQC